MNGPDDFTALQAAMLLAHWGEDEGFDYLESFVCAKPPLAENWTPHRLRSYDDTYKQVLDALNFYWARKSDIGKEDEARKKLYRPMTKIIKLAGQMPFDISYFFDRIERDRLTEYIPPLKDYLIEILKHPELHHWKIADCVHLLMKFDSEFVTQVLAAYGKMLTDYPGGL